jgi:uncharacterized surface protein with fasciclin (FAS1) repeats
MLIDKYLKILFKRVFVLMLLAAGCKKDDIAPVIDRTTVPRNIGEFIENNYDLSLLNAALKKTGLSDSLKLPGAFTIFAPDNAGFNTLGIASAADIEKMNTDSLRYILRGHIIMNRYFISSFPFQMGNRYRTQSGEYLYVSVNGNKQQAADTRGVCVNGAYVMEESKRNISLANGVLHVIKKPLQYNSGTVQEYITNDTSLVIFAAAMKRFGFWDGLNAEGPLTIMAPANEAFLRYGLTADSIGRMNPASYKELTFGIYCFMQKAKHIFSTDGSQITGTVYGDNGIKMDGYSILPNFQYSTWSNTIQASIGVQWYDGSWWLPNEKGPSAVQYKGIETSGADHVSKNGIVHVITDLIFYPERMKK